MRVTDITTPILQLTIAAVGLVTVACFARAQPSGRLATPSPALAATTPAVDARANGATPNTATQPRFSPSVVVPTGPVAEVRAADGAARRATAERLLSGGALDATQQGEVRWLAAEAARRAGEIAPHRAQLSALMATPHPLARWARLRLAQSYLEHHPRDPARAAELAVTLTDPWAGRWTARMTVARAHIATGDPANAQDAIDRLRAILAETDPLVTGASAGMPLARLLADQAEVGPLIEAIGIYRRVATRAPGTEMAAAALQSADELVARLPRDLRAAHADVPLDDQLVAAGVLARGLQFEEAIAAYDALLEDLPAAPPVAPASSASADEATVSAAAATHAPPVLDARHCLAGLGRGQALMRLRRRSEASPALIAVAERCVAHPDPAAQDAAAWARYDAGRALTALGKPDEAIVQFEALEREHRTHRLADDARVRAALLHREQGRTERFRVLLADIGQRYPSGDMTGRALFQLAWEAFSRRDFATALAHLDAVLLLPGAEPLEGMEGRALYWRARSLAALGRNEDAVAGYTRVATTWPLSYYAQHAMVRLRVLDEARAERLEASLRHTGPEPTLDFRPRPEFQSQPFLAAISLMRVGDMTRARWELEELGALGEGADPDILWTVAAMYDRAGERPAAARLVREHIGRGSGHGGWRRVAPRGRGRALWRLAYPRAFAPLIEESAARESVPAAFVRAIAREESSFNPRAVSWARAYGLVQIILPTARRFGRQLGLRVNSRTLRDAETNLRIGTHYMRFLFDRYETNPGLVPAAYNAGNGAVDRWLRDPAFATSERSLDRFVEEIPYDETRRYTRRVLQSYGIYSWLDTGALPTLPTGLPPR